MNEIEVVIESLLRGKEDDLSKVFHEFDVNSFDSYGNNILHYCIKNRESILYPLEDIIKELVNQGLDLNACQSKSPGKSALHWAIHDKNKKIVELLISLNADVDVIDEDGNTPFGYTGVS